MLVYYLLVYASPFVRHPLWAGRLGDVTLVKYLGIACCAYALYYIGMRQRPPSLTPYPQVWAFVLLFLLSFFSYTLAGSAALLVTSPMAFYSSQAANLFVTASVVDSARRVRNVLLVAIASLDYGSLHALREWQHAGFARSYRPGYVLGDPNWFAVSVVLFLPAALYLLNERPNCWWQRPFCLGSLPLITAAFVACSSRGGLLGLGVALLLMVWRSRHRIPALILMVILVFTLSVLPTSPLRRLTQPSASDMQSTEARRVAWRAGIRMMQAHPFTGVGIGQFKNKVLSYELPGERVHTLAHNTYIEIGSELGLTGLTLLLGVLGFSLFTLQQCYRKMRSLGDQLLLRASMALEAGLLGAIVTISTLTATTHKFLWLVIFLAITIHRLATEQGTPAVKSEGVYAAGHDGPRR